MSLKDFTIMSKLGQGAYSIVYKIKRLADNKDYALKKVKLNNLSEKEIQNALNEVRILASFKNNFIVKYKQAFLENKNLCIVMEFADDGDLYQKIVEHQKKKELFEEIEIWNVLVQVLIGLKNLHALNILHRDLKSANIFLNKNGQAKLGDLNVSKEAKNGLLYTQTGTPYYASPEVWNDQPYNSKSDIWSLGCVIYQMTTLHPPFQAEDMEGLMNAVTLGMYPPLNSKYSKELTQVIKMMLQQNSKNRPSAEQLFTCGIVEKKIEELQLEAEKMSNSSNSELLKTIRIPKKLHYLTDRLPKSNYQELQSNPTSPSKQNSSSLPKLSNKVHLHKQINYPKKKRENNILMIEGISKVIEGARSQQKPQKPLDREIRDEIKRIYKGKKQNKSKILKRSDKSIILPPIRL